MAFDIAEVARHIHQPTVHAGLDNGDPNARNTDSNIQPSRSLSSFQQRLIEDDQTDGTSQLLPNQTGLSIRHAVEGLVGGGVAPL